MHDGPAILDHGLSLMNSTASLHSLHLYLYAGFHILQQFCKWDLAIYLLASVSSRQCHPLRSRLLNGIPSLIHFANNTTRTTDSLALGFLGPYIWIAAYDSPKLLTRLLYLLLASASFQLQCGLYNMEQANQAHTTIGQ